MSAPEPLKIDFTQADDVLKLYPHSPLLSSQQAEWGEIQLQYHQHPPHELSENYSKQHRIIIHDRSPISPSIEEMIEHRFYNSQLGERNITLVPAAVLNSASWNTNYRFITLSFEPSTFARHTFDLINGIDTELIPNFSKPDPLIHSIGLALKSELESSGAGSRLYIDSLITALMTHLLRHYSVQKQPAQTDANSLSKQKLQQVVDYIHQHLDQDLALSELAALVQISSSYFSILFKQSTGLAPHQYVIQCRVDRAKQLLLQDNTTIAEVAHSLGFSHQSHLSRHFKRLVGVTPRKFLQSQ